MPFDNSSQERLWVVQMIARRTGIRGTLEFRFHPTRKWRFDIAWPLARVALEVDGGTWARKGAHRCAFCGQMPLGGHSQGAQAQRDREKRNAAAACGWVMLSVIPKQLCTEDTLALVQAALAHQMKYHGGATV